MPLPNLAVAAATVAAAARLEILQRADRCGQHRDAQFAAEYLMADIDVRDIAQHPRPEADRVERQTVARQRRPRFPEAPIR